MIFYAVKALLIQNKYEELNDRIMELKRERDRLIQNTASFKKFSKSQGI